MTIVWRHIAHSLRGPSHAAEDTPCQDSNAIRVLGENASISLLACVADGAGSSKYSDEGSSIACNAIVENAIAFCKEHGSLVSLKYDDIIEWCDDARRRIVANADIRGCEPREFATTFCAAIISADRSRFFQIGDGAIIAESNGAYGVVFWPQSGEYANTTNFLTAPDYKQHLEFLETPHSFAKLAMITDGMERLALLFENQTPHPPFFLPLFAALRSTEDSKLLGDELRKFLESDSVRNRSDDDKTIVLVSRVSEEGGAND